MKKFITILSLLIIMSIGANAQLVTIPDSHFVTWLQSNYPACMTGNQLDTTCSSIQSTAFINATHDSLSDLTGIQYFINLRSLNCGYNLISTIPSLPATLTTFICDSNQLSSLPALPSGITYLSCEVNLLSTLPSLPASLDTLMCGRNTINSIPALPNSLMFLSCYQNQLTALPALDSLLTNLICYNNLLTSLPVLDSALSVLSCGINQLTILPALTNNLTDLKCYMNQLTFLPVLDNVLSNLDCSSNRLPSLPVLPNSLTTLNCSSNPLQNMPVLTSNITSLMCNQDSLYSLPVLPLSLNYLSCANNYLSSLPALPNSLVSLSCNNNQITTLPALPSSLISLECSSNPLPALPSLPLNIGLLSCNNNLLTALPTLPNSLYELDCYSNQLTSLPILSSSLARLHCGNNQLTNLPQLPAVLSELNCEQNHLTGLPVLPNSMTYLWCENNNISCFPILPVTITDTNKFNIAGNPFTCLPNYVHAMRLNDLSVPLCGIGNVSGCPAAIGILGFTFRDNNSNCIKDNADSVLINIPLKNYNSTNNLISQTYTALNGIYDFTDTTGTYTIRIDTAGVPFMPQCINPGIDSTVALTNSASLIQDVNFSLICKPGFDVGTQSVITNGLVFPGQTHTLRINAGDMSHWYNMHCAAGISGQVKVTVTGPITFAGVTAGSLTPSITNNVYTYSIPDFDNINNQRDFGLQFTTNAYAQGFDVISVNVSVTPAFGDNDTTNNNYNYSYHVINSHDPNLKETCPEKVLAGYNDYFTYTVHFQNTGTAPAINIRLLDTLDGNLDLNTFQVINFSHPNVVSLIGKVITFNFQNINLPDSTSNLDGSRGFVQYKIKPKSNLHAGVVIHNTASIYFDFNTPLSTNTSLNVFMESITTSIKEQSMESGLSIYPNPSKGIFQISSTLLKIQYVKIINIIGEEIFQTNNDSKQAIINLSSFEKGIYFVQIRYENNFVSNKKVVVE